MKPDLSSLKLGEFDLSILPPSLLGKIVFTPERPNASPLSAGRHFLELDETRDSLLIVPDGIAVGQPAPLLIVFHGANGSAEAMLNFFEDHALKHGFLLLAPQSTFHTWDLSLAGHGPDLDRLERALQKISTHFLLDKKHLGLAGFSDGASYALSTGLSNGDWVSHVIALSGGFMNVYKPLGKPAIFIAHSPEDEQLPINTTGRKHATQLENAGYEVEYLEFSGPHVIQQPVVDRAIEFFLTKNVSRTVR